MRALNPYLAPTPQTTVVHNKREHYDVYIGRPGPWGNPFLVDDFDSREDCLAIYAEWLQRQHHLLEQLHTLKGKVLGCWCAPKSCHGHVLAALADGLTWDAYLPQVCDGKDNDCDGSVVAPTDGLTLIGNIGGKLLPADLPLNTIVVSPAGLVARITDQWTEKEVYRKKDNSEAVRHRKKCQLTELGRWSSGEFHPSESGYSWEIYSTYQHKGGDLGGWAAWGDSK